MELELPQAWRGDFVPNCFQYAEELCMLYDRPGNAPSHFCGRSREVHRHDEPPREHPYVEPLEEREVG